MFKTGLDRESGSMFFLLIRCVKWLVNTVKMWLTFSWLCLPAGYRSLTPVLTRSVCRRIETGRSSSTNSPSPSQTRKASAWSDLCLFDCGSDCGANRFWRTDDGTADAVCFISSADGTLNFSLAMNEMRTAKEKIFLFAHELLVLFREDDVKTFWFIGIQKEKSFHKLHWSSYSFIENISMILKLQ